MHTKNTTGISLHDRYILIFTWLSALFLSLFQYFSNLGKKVNFTNFTSKTTVYHEFPTFKICQLSNIIFLEKHFHNASPKKVSGNFLRRKGNPVMIRLKFFQIFSLSLFQNKLMQKHTKLVRNKISDYICTLPFGKKEQFNQIDITGKEKRNFNALMSSIQVALSGIKYSGKWFSHAKCLSSQACFGLVNPTLSPLIGSHKCFRMG